MVVSTRLIPTAVWLVIVASFLAMLWRPDLFMIDNERTVLGVVIGWGLLALWGAAGPMFCSPAWLRSAREPGACEKANGETHRT